MIPSRIKVGSLAALLAVLALISWATIGAARSTPQGPESATPAQAKMFEELLRRQERILFDSMVNGDTSLFPTVLYNDATVDLHPDFAAAIDEAGEANVNAALASAQPGPKGAERGYLSGEVASIIVMFRSVNAWEAVEAQAKAEGRAPSSADMPNGAVPIPRKSPEEWVYVPFRVFNTLIKGDHATTELEFIDPAEVDENHVPWFWEHYVFTRVEGTWYITGMTSTTT